MSHNLKFQKFINELGQYALWNFELIRNFAHTAVLLTEEKSC